MIAGLRALRRLGAILVASVVVAAAAGCGQQTSTGAPTRPGASPTDPSPPATSAGPPSAAGSSEDADCPIVGERLALPSDRLVDLALASGPGSDVASFILEGTPTAAGGNARAELSVAAPPFSRGGQAIDLAGHRFLEIRFLEVRTREASGAAVFRGERDIETELPALRQLTVVDETDGLIAWYVGFDGPGCVSFALDPGGSRAVLTVGHARG